MNKSSTPSITVTVKKVNRSLTPQEVLDATGRRQYTDKAVVATMPSGGSGVQENIPVEFFKLGRWISDADLAREYEERDLVSDPYAQAQVNTDDPTFADEHPNGTRWTDANGKECFVTFDRHGGVRLVYVNRCDYGWGGFWWFGGVRK